MDDVRAVLENFADPARRKDRDRWEAFQAGGGGLVRRADVDLDGATCTWEGDHLDVAFASSAGRIEASPSALELPDDWQAYGRLRLSLTAPDAAVRVGLTVVGARCRLRDECDLAGGETAEIELDLSDLPLAAGVRPLYEPAAVRISAWWVGGDTTRQVLLGDLVLEAAPERKAPQPVVDRFGQRIHASWPGKVASEGDLSRAAADEATSSLAAAAPPGRWNEFGGWTGGPSFEAGGFFRVDRDDDGRWWLVDPTGRPFWSVGVTGIRTTHGGTPVAGREFLYEELPDPAGPLADAYGERGLSFYCLNVLRKYGSKEAWRERVLERLRAWGLNTVGCWSEDLMLDQPRVPHVRFIRSTGEGAPMATGRFPDVFDPAWREWLGGELAASAGPHRDDPLLLGYFVDNELPWRGTALMDAPAEGPLKRAWESFVRERHPRIEEVPGPWSRPVQDWPDLRHLTTEDVPESGRARDLVRSFVGRYAEVYFRTIAERLKAHDPNHLYLGCRFVQNPPGEAIVRAARHADVVSVNCYSLYPDRGRFDGWHAACGRPILIGEHHLALRGPRQLEPLYPAFTERERQKYHVQYVREIARRPYGVGCHWYQWADQPLTGRPGDGEDQTIGLVDVADLPHAELVAATREVAANVYGWHASAE